VNLHIKLLEATDRVSVQKIYSSSATKTFQHTPDFIAYHGDKFQDVSIIVFDGDSPIAFCLAAIEPSNGHIATSHPGSAFGGLIFVEGIQGAETLTIVESVLQFYSSLGFKEFKYKETPYIYSTKYSADLQYATFKNGGEKISSLLSCALDLRNSPTYSSQRIRGIRKGKQNVDIRFGWQNIDGFWNILIQNLETKHKSKPVHTLEEIHRIRSCFKNEVELVVAQSKVQDEILAGVILFKSDVVWKTQYIASGDFGRKSGALDELFNNLATAARNAEIKYLDFGTSNEPSSGILNEGLYRFKTGFGAGGVVYDQYRFLL
jgi:hypothetical protein